MYLKWKNNGVLGIDMAAAAIYTLAAKFDAKALSISAVIDDIFKEDVFKKIVTVSLNTLIDN